MVAPDRLTVPTVGTVWRSILAATDFSVSSMGDWPVQELYGFPCSSSTSTVTWDVKHFGNLNGKLEAINPQSSRKDYRSAEIVACKNTCTDSTAIYLLPFTEANR
jgi:hypothetical protein